MSASVHIGRWGNDSASHNCCTSTDAFDPEEDAEDAVDLDLPRDQFMLAYYLPFLRCSMSGGRLSTTLSRRRFSPTSTFR